MKKSIITLLISMVMVLSIFLPVTTGNVFETGKDTTYKEYAQKDIGFRDSKIHSELLDKIAKEEDKEESIIVTVGKGKNKDNVEKTLLQARGKEIKHHKLANAFSAKVKVKDIKNIAEIPDVERIYPDFKVKVALDDSVPIIRADTLWSKYNGSGITVAVIDTGIDKNHPDLKNKVVNEVSFVPDEPSPDDGFGHGTHVAGIVAGSGAASGSKYTGVAPGASLMNVKVLGKYGWGTASSVMSGIEYAVDHGADVISLSIGAGFWPPDGTDPVAMTANAAVDAGVVVVAAAGNSGAPFLIISPASAEKVIAVGATTKQDNIAMYSSEGPTWDHRIKPEVVAPGGAAYIESDPAGLGIVSAKAPGSLLDIWLPEYSVDKYYMALSGTSMATPHVSGVAALMLQAHPDWTPQKIKKQLMNTGVDLGYDPITQGAGRIDAKMAVESTLNVAPAALSYIANPGSYDDIVLEISNSGKKKMTASFSSTGDVDVKFQKDTITVEPGKTRKVKVKIGVPAGVSAGLHYGSIVVRGNDNAQSVRLPVLIDTPMTFVNRISEFSDVIKLKTSEYYSTGTKYYYFDVPQRIPGITSTMRIDSVPGYLYLYLLDPSGEFVDYDYSYSEKPVANVSVINPKPGRWMLLVDSYIFDPAIENVSIAMSTNLNSLTIEPVSWIIPSVISTGTGVNQTFTVTNTGEAGKSVQVESYIAVPNSSASGVFSGDVIYNIDMPTTSGSHTFDIPADAVEYTLTMTALNNTAVLVADIFNPDGMWTDSIWFGLWEPSTASTKIYEPVSGTWRVDIWPIYAETSTTEYYRGSYDVLSKNTSWITSSPESLVIQAKSQGRFTSTLTPPADANGDYTGKLTISGNGEVLKVPVSVSAGQSVTYPGNFTGDIRNKAWRYYSVNLNSDHLNAIITWDNIYNDIDLFAFDPSGKAVASSVQTNTREESVNVSNPVAGTWTVGVYGYDVIDVQRFSGTVD